MRLQRHEAKRHEANDSGFSLIEVVVAMGLFAVLATATLGITVRTVQLSASNHRRVEAANLANRQVEAIRAMRAVDIPDGRTKTSDTVGGTTYTITQDSAYVADSSHATICAGTGNALPDKRVTVTVTWPNMDVPAVQVDTLRAVGIGSVDQTKGSIALSVLGADGHAVPDIPVALAPGGATITTGADGCAFFANLAPSTYTATASSVGYVGVTNNQSTAAAGIGVSNATVTRAQLIYDTVRDVTLTPQVPAGTPVDAVVPSGVPVMIRNSTVGPVNLPECSGGTAGCLEVTGTPLGTTRYLYPDIYELWTGTCADSLPRTTADLVPASVDGGTLSVGMGGALVDVQLGGVSTAGQPVYVRHAPDASSCAAGESYDGPASAVGGVGVILPYGEWTFSLQDTFPAGPGTATVTLDPTTVGNVVLAA